MEKKGNKKGCVIGCLLAGILGLGGLGACVWTVFMITAPVAEASDLFLAKIGQGKAAEAYQEASSTLRAGSTEEEFTAAVRNLGLDGYQSASWSSRNIENDEGSVSGTVKTKTGEIPLAITLRLEDGVWRVASFTKSKPEAPLPASGKQAPSEEELRPLVNASLQALAKALKTSDFTEFHAGLATAFREKHDPAAIAASLSVLASQQDAIGRVAEFELVYDEPPSLDAGGDLKANGNFVAESKRVLFQLWFSHEEGEWKLLQINVKVQAAKTEDAPPTEELQRMAKESLLAFNEAVKSQSFVSFRSEQCSPRFQAEVSAERFAEVFKQFVEQKVDIGAISEHDPVFKTVPAVDENNVLNLEGHYPTQPKQVGFTLQYEFVEGIWKLQSINLTID